MHVQNILSSSLLNIIGYPEVSYYYIHRGYSSDHAILEQHQESVSVIFRAAVKLTERHGQIKDDDVSGLTSVFPCADTDKRFANLVHVLPTCTTDYFTPHHVLSNCRTILSLQVSVSQTRYRSLPELWTTRARYHREDSPRRIRLSRSRQAEGHGVYNITSARVGTFERFRVCFWTEWTAVSPRDPGQTFSSEQLRPMQMERKTSSTTPIHRLREARP